MRHKSFILFIVCILQACLVSRTERPRLTGYVFDAETKSPIINCNIGEAKTNNLGYFELKERRYLEFTWLGMEAPPIYINEIVYHADYLNDTIQLFSNFGGGLKRGAHWEVDTIFLKRKTKL